MSFFSDIKTYPYRERLPSAAIMLCIGVWMFRNSGSVTYVEGIGAVAVAITLFVGARGRTFWFLWGIAVGIALASLTWAHSFLVH